jgi:hypothetical protein
LDKRTEITVKGEGTSSLEDMKIPEDIGCQAVRQSESPKRIGVE